MPVAFGFSVGDFIAALNLVHDAIEAIHSTRGSSATYRALLRELYVLESALLRVKNLELEESLESERRALEQTASQCQRAIDDFFARIQAYQPHLRAGGSGNSSWARLKDTWMKVKWALCKEEDVEKFKADLRGHSTSIQLLLQTIEMKNASIQARKNDRNRDTIAGQVQNASSALMSSVSSISSGILSCLQQGKEQLQITTTIMRANLQIFNMVLDIHKFLSRLPYQIQRDQPVYMIDAFGRLTPFHLEFIRSAEGLLAVLRVNFEAAGVGTEKIDRRQIVFEDTPTRREIDITRNWESCFRPGQRVSMSVVFENASRDVGSTCPHCHAEQQGPPDRDIECVVCHLVFRRIVDLPEVAGDIRARVHHSKGPRNEIPLSKSWSSTQPNLPATASKPTDSNQISLFRRVRIIPPKEAHKCKLWALWNHETGDMTLEGIGGICIRTIRDRPFLELFGDDESETPNEMLIFEPIPCEELYYQRMDRQRIVVSGQLQRPVYSSQAPLAHALDFKEKDWCEAIWATLAATINNQNPEPVMSPLLWHKYSQDRPSSPTNRRYTMPSGGGRGGGGSRKPPPIHGGGGQSSDPNTSTSASNAGFYN